MAILCWDKPSRALSVPEWKQNSFEDGPPGGYLPNMSKESSHKWRAVLKGKTTATPQVEIRTACCGSQMLLVVSLGDGYRYKYWKPEDAATKGINVHQSLNGPARMTFEQAEEMVEAIREARAVLEALPPPSPAKLQAKP